MAEYIGCRNCDSPSCKGCNIYTLGKMLNAGKFDCLMNGNRSINPFADVVEVVHGRWIDGADSFGAKRGTFRVCSRCNTCFPRDDRAVPPSLWRACPNCFLRMDGE